MNVLDEAIQIITCIKSWPLSTQLFKHMRWQTERYTKSTVNAGQSMTTVLSKRHKQSSLLADMFLHINKNSPVTGRKTDSTCCQLSILSFPVKIRVCVFQPRDRSITAVEQVGLLLLQRESTCHRSLGVSVRGCWHGPLRVWAWVEWLGSGSQEVRVLYILHAARKQE